MGAGVWQVMETVFRAEALPVADRFEWWRI